MIDLHAHFGQINDKYFNPEQIINNLLRFGVKQIGLMPILNKRGDNVEESHEIFKKLCTRYKKSIIPILWIHPSTKIDGIERFLEEFPYKIIKIHGYLHPWHKNNIKLLQIIRLAKERNLPIMFHTGGRKESYSFSYKKICKDNPDNIFILAHSRPVRGTVNVMLSCPNVYCDLAFTPIKDIRILIENKLEDRILYGTDYPVISAFNQQIDVDNWHNDRVLEVKSIMTKEVFEKISKNNFTNLFLV